jgi:two-component system cell cycle sensor histidine kinase/response regulator CckA
MSRLGYTRRMTEAVPGAGSATAVERTPVTILVVEDDPVLRDLMRRVLEQEGYSVLVAGNGDEAIGIARHFTQPLHLVIADVVLPGVSGFDVADRVWSCHPERQVLYITGYAEVPVVRQELGETRQRSLLKPFTKEELLQNVREILGPRLVKP